MAGNPVNAPRSGDDHPMIAAHLARLDARLPTDIVDELADGLHETYLHHLACNGRADLAAAAAVAEFGDPDTVSQSFEDQSPGRRTATALLTTGPLVGACWAAALITGHAWTWPVPLAARLALGAALVGTVAVLVRLVFGRVSYRRLNRAAAAAGCLMLALDTLLIAAALANGLPGGGILVLAGAASGIRLAFTAGRLGTMMRA